GFVPLYHSLVRRGPWPPPSLPAVFRAAPRLYRRRHSRDRTRLRCRLRARSLGRRWLLGRRHELGRQQHQHQSQRQHQQHQPRRRQHDDAVRARFVTSYDAKHQLMTEGDNKAVLVIGDNDYPFPIPLARNKNGTWSFDTAAGRQEILARRIGHNELDAIQTSLAYVDAQNDYAAKDRGDGEGVYAQRFISESGKKNGLYWPTTQGEEESPLGELFAAASRQGYRTGEGRSPYHGYYYKILTRQGPAAAGGAADYVVRGKMIGGFALVAYPAEYRNSGV